MNLQPVILCGGAGTRLWPLSREQYPKQLLALVGEQSMLEAAVRRVDASIEAPGRGVNAPFVVSNEEYRYIVAEQLRRARVAPRALILEPVGRGTAPALTLAALAAANDGDDPVLVVMPADHVVADVAAFHEGVMRAAAQAEIGRIAAFGVRPTSAQTGYGYIRAGAPRGGGGGARALGAFVEKPDPATAERYLRSGEYFWNAGIFVLRASVWIAQLEALHPQILAACRAAYAACRRDHDFLRVDKGAFAAGPSDSIDYAVMEKLPDDVGAVVPLAAGWSDVGAWDALWELGEKDADGNMLRGDVVALTTRNTLAISQSRLVACVGLTDAVLVETPDAVLAAHKSHMQQVKEIVARLKREGRPEAQAHRKIYRPWGYYDSVDAGSRFQVKRIVVNPGAAISLQMHHHRAEHWIVVRGTARVTRGEEVFLVSENESTFIPLGTRHRLENPGKIPLEIVEVQSGAYLNEDDIVRFEDSYGRA